LAERILKPGGNFVIKIFQGEGFDVYLKDARKKFDKIQMIKPDSSRGSSREQYMLAWGYRRESE
jgi:23S rRNA (uridine2552-2'-O)-methyltransferase